MKKAVNQWCFASGMPIAEVFEKALAAHLAGVELNIYEPGEVGLTLETTEQQARALKKQADDVGVALPSLSNGLLWKWPLSSPDAGIRQRAREVVQKQIALAGAMRMDAVLVVPGLVDEKTSYEECWKRSQDEVATLALLAAEHGVKIGIENVWNRFLLSPLDMVRYLDEIGSPFVGAYFDVGNVCNVGYPEQWIRSLSKRIVKVHVKDFSLAVGNIHGFVPLLSGDVNWPAVMASLRAIGYDDYLTAEVTPYAHDDGQAVRDASAALDRIMTL